MKSFRHSVKFFVMTINIYIPRNKLILVSFINRDILTKLNFCIYNYQHAPLVHINQIMRAPINIEERFVSHLSTIGLNL